MDVTAKRLKWLRSVSCANATCVEVAKFDDRYLIRDSKNPDGAVLSFSQSEWDAFIGAVKRDEFRFE